MGRALTRDDLVQRWALTYERVEQFAKKHVDFPKEHKVVGSDSFMYWEEDVLAYEKNHEDLLHTTFRGRCMRKYFHPIQL